MVFIGSEDAYCGRMGCYTLHSVALVPAFWRDVVRVACLKIIIRGSYKAGDTLSSRHVSSCDVMRAVGM